MGIAEHNEVERSDFHHFHGRCSGGVLRAAGALTRGLGPVALHVQLEDHGVLTMGAGSISGIPQQLTTYSTNTAKA